MDLIIQNSKFGSLLLCLKLNEYGYGSITLQNDFRVTKFGKILRKTKLNELPQIINILKGDISIVGPRPLVLNDFKAYPKNIQDIIYDVKPGLTGLGSLIFRDEEKIISENSDHKNPHKYYKKYIAPYKGSLELYYQKNKSLILDFKIIFLTALVIIFQKVNYMRNGLLIYLKGTFN